jgi:hypothetical protein
MIAYTFSDSIHSFSYFFLRRRSGGAQLLRGRAETLCAGVDAVSLALARRFI